MGSIPLTHVAEVDGANAEALRRAEAGEPDQWILADRQTAGRGRRGRAWSSQKGDLMVTRLVTLDPRRASFAPELSFVTAVALVDACADMTDRARLSLKWPNDVLLDGAKLAGVLLESAMRSGGAARAGAIRVAVGVGVNLTAKPDVDRPTAHLAGVDRDALFTAFAAAFDARLALWAREGFAPVREAWRVLAHGLGARARTVIDGRTVEGQAIDLADDGALLLRMDDGRIRRITAGDVDVL